MQKQIRNVLSSTLPAHQKQIKGSAASALAAQGRKGGTDTMWARVGFCVTMGQYCFVSAHLADLSLSKDSMIYSSDTSDADAPGSNPALVRQRASLLFDTLDDSRRSRTKLEQPSLSRARPSAQHGYKVALTLLFIRAFGRNVMQFLRKVPSKSCIQGMYGP